MKLCFYRYSVNGFVSRAMKGNLTLATNFILTISLGLNNWLIQLIKKIKSRDWSWKINEKEYCLDNRDQPFILRTGVMQTARKAMSDARVNMKLPPQFPRRAENSEFDHVYATMTLARCSRRAIDRSLRW